MNVTPKRKSLSIFLMVFTFFSVVVHAQENKPSVSLEHPDTIVKGLPFPVVYSVRGPINVVHSNLISSNNPFRLKLVDGEKEIYFEKAHDKLHYFPNRPVYHTKNGSVDKRFVRLPLVTNDVDPNEKILIGADLTQADVTFKEKTFEFSDVNKSPEIPPGTYRIRLLNGDIKRTKSKKRRVRLKNPNEEEKRLLKRVFEISKRIYDRKKELLRENPLWSTYVIRFPEVMRKVDQEKLSKAAKKQLVFYNALAKLVQSKRPLSELEFRKEWLNEVLPEYRHLLLYLRYEIEIAHGDLEAAGRSRKKILKHRSHWKDLLDDVADHGGFIRRYRILQKTLVKSKGK